MERWIIVRLFHFLLERQLLAEGIGASFWMAFCDESSEVLLSSTLPIFQSSLRVLSFFCEDCHLAFSNERYWVGDIGSSFIQECLALRDSVLHLRGGRQPLREGRATRTLPRMGILWAAGMKRIALTWMTAISRL